MLSRKSSGRRGFTPLKIFLGLAVLASSLQAAQATQATASGVLHYRYTLTDLAPQDNIAPSFTWTENYRYIRAEAWREDWDDSQYNHYDEDNASPMTDSAILGADWVANSITGSAQGDGETISANTFTSSADDGGPFDDFFHEAVSGRAFNGILSANTAITFYLDYALSTTGPDRNAKSSLGFRVWHGEPLGPRPPDFFLFNLQEEVFASNARNASAIHTYENTKSSTELIGSDVTLWTASALSQDPAQVPEPSPYLMFATGLGLLAWRKRRANGHTG